MGLDDLKGKKKAKAKDDDKTSSGSSSGNESRSGLTKGIVPEEIDVVDYIEVHDGEFTDEEERQAVEDLGYALPLRVMDLGGEGTGKSSDWAHPEIPRPMGDEKVTFITVGPEAKMGIHDRWGMIPPYVDIFRLDWNPEEPRTASEAVAAFKEFVDLKIANGGTCNLVFDDMEKCYDELLRDKCRHEFGWNPAEIRFDDDSSDFWSRRKELAKLMVSKLQECAQHLLVMSGYDEEVNKRLETVDGEEKLVRKVEDPGWVEPFEKPFHIKLLRDKVTIEADEDEGLSAGERMWRIEVTSSKFSGLFPEAQRLDVTGTGVARFWEERSEGTEVPDVLKEYLRQREQQEGDSANGDGGEGDGDGDE